MVLDTACCVLEQVKYALYSSWKEPKMFRYAVRGDWDLIPKRCQTHPKEAAFVHKYVSNDTALHRILRPNQNELDSVEFDPEAKKQVDRVKLKAVSALLEACPALAVMGDAFGRTPLHLACMDLEDSSVDVIMVMLQHCRSSVACLKRDVEGRTPLHYLISRNDQIPLELVKQYLKICPNVITVQDAVRETPLDILESRRDEVAEADAIANLFQSTMPK